LSTRNKQGTLPLIASMLGVRSEGITEIAGNLQRTGLISYRRRLKK
jgi:Mn-dependent DtxR family transcriptional regulator